MIKRTSLIQALAVGIMGLSAAANPTGANARTTESKQGFCGPVCYDYCPGSPSQWCTYYYGSYCNIAYFCGGAVSCYPYAAQWSCYSFS
jgi:hypothetical protein